MNDSNGFLVESKLERNKGNTDPERAEQWRKASQRYRDKKRKVLTELQEKVDAAQREIDSLKAQHSLTIAEFDKESKDNEMLWNSFAISPTAKMWREVFNFEERLFDLLTHWKRKRTMDSLPPTGPNSPSSTPNHGTSTVSTPSSTAHFTPGSNPSTPSAASSALVTTRYFTNDYPHHNADYPPTSNDKYNRMSANNATMASLSPHSCGNSGNSPSSYVRASVIQGSRNDSDGDDPDGASPAASAVVNAHDSDPFQTPPPDHDDNAATIRRINTATTSTSSTATTTATPQRGTNLSPMMPSYFLSHAAAPDSYYAAVSPGASTASSNSNSINNNNAALLGLHSSLPALHSSLYSPGLLRNDPLLTSFPSASMPSSPSTPQNFMGGLGSGPQLQLPCTPELFLPSAMFPGALRREKEG